MAGTGAGLTTRAHLLDLAADLQQALKAHLDSGKFTLANELRSELAWVTAQLGNGRYRPVA